MTAAEAPPALLRRVGHVAVITLNRPHAMNAITAAMSLAVQDAIDELIADPDLRVGILTGAGDRAFSAGADLKEVAAGRPLIDQSQRERGFGGFLKSGLAKPLIAAVNGYALGGGTELLLACDLAVMSGSATLGLPEVTRGIIAAGGGLLRLSKRVPLAIALEMSLTGAPISADEALRWGLVNRVVPPEQVLDTALELANVVAANAPLAVQASKRVTYAARDAGSDFGAAAWALSDGEAKTVMRTNDAKEGPRAFTEKRAPVWSGT
ncbi:crotonase/enoyl-CoA hydratase family protein [Mycolicibacterium sp. CBMA 226]|uniref:crotonase/enoyl-CoA hydratase family protein n=1 Tax=Mycolicibacterium sp. CBMA 226 TaxID=2606611 RepID=UPI00130C71FB|nr:crotonase/enoyl-CoA hydratase family protein [Mycolicibacterium sp. CBMA 226]MUL78690.1 crotonase/enoyl-CoA hydratase family protein [Mycolicibacterium sp. CBMA 226]